MSHKKDLHPHPALRTVNGDLHNVTIATDGANGLPSRMSVFVDGHELVSPADSVVEISRSTDDFARITVTLFAETLEDITWDEMEERLIKE